MSRYIDADELVQTIVNTPTHAFDDIAFWHSDALTGLQNRQNEILDMIDAMPTAYDVEKVVEKVQKIQISSAGQRARIIHAIRGGGEND